MTSKTFAQALRIPAAALACAVAFGASAQADYPSKPVTIVVPFPAGGTTDIVARAIAEKLTARFKQPVVVENRSGGAGGSVGAAMVARAAPDGYTLMVTSPGPLVINHLLYKDVGYDPATAFAPISLCASVPIILAASPNFPAKNLKQLVDMAKAKPGSVNFASAGNGGTAHLTMELLRQTANLSMVHVPFPGSAPAITAVVGGHVQVLFDNSPTILPQVKAGRLHPLGVASAKRVAAAPDIPTIAEQGYPGFESTSWFGILAPAGTPAPIVDKLGKEIADILHAPDQVKHFQDVGVDLVGSTPAEFATFIASEAKKWGTVYKASGAKLD